MQVRDVPLKDITIKDRARHDMGDVASLAENIKAVGLIQPISIDQNGKLLAGHRRYLAHEKLGATTISAIIRHVAGVVDAKEVELFENTQRKNLHWHEAAVLEKEIFEYKNKTSHNWSQVKQGAERGLAQSTVSRRIRLAEAIEMLPELAEYKTEDEAWKEYKRLEEDAVRDHLHQRYLPEVKEAMAKAGEHFKIGDAFEGMAALPANSFNFAEVDTPYGVDLDKRKGRNDDTKPMESYNEWDTSEYSKLFARTAQEVYRILDDHAFAVFWYGMSWHDTVLKTLREVGFGVPDIPAIWTKGDAGQTASPNTTLGSCYEPFFLVRKGSPVLAKPGRSNVFNFPKLPSATKDHPTQKPLLLLRAIIETCIFPGSKIIVPYLGSGVTLRAAYKLGHTGIGWDMSPVYRNAFLKRVAEDQRDTDDDRSRDSSADD